MNYSSGHNAITLLSVKSNSNNVAYIEAGARPDLEEKKIEPGQTIYFLFPKSVSQLNAIAFDSNGNELYYYGYRKNTSYFTSGNFGWHKFRK